MDITPFHTKYYGHELTKRCSSDKLEKLASSLVNATVDLNPHQIDAALFAFRSPLSRGALLADEVGLGKTIEACLIMNQLWAEGNRHILCIVPASLQKQWYGEITEKFYLNATILESKNYKQLAPNGCPFNQEKAVIICSYHFAKSHKDEIAAANLDLVVIDEAHRLRNVYRDKNKIAKAISEAVSNFPKILLTATPLQNSLMELYGLITFIDPHIFGSEDVYREQYVRNVADMTETDFNRLKSRISPVCQRTLRRQVTEYVHYTDRISITQDFTPSKDELKLYDYVSKYLQREQSFALPSGQRKLLTLILRKILASSSFAISATLGTMIDRLGNLSSNLSNANAKDVTKRFADDFESIYEMQEEWAENEDELTANLDAFTEDEQKQIIIKAVQNEITELRNYKLLAESIVHNAKGEALLIALKAGFVKAKDINAPQKAVIFTESKRTQTYLQELLIANGYSGQVVILNGTNESQYAKEIYKQWLERNKYTDYVKMSKSVDIRSALIEEFRDRASILIATESGAEGLNLQFCSLVVNYDLPWNPQRIEQRIGRCHRYGQKCDVVVINFLNRANEADKRVFELLSEKLKLFDGVFGASDEVLGALGSGVDFEQRIFEIYQCCRTPDEINFAFDRLQQDLEESIRNRFADTRKKLLEHFDEDVHARLRLNRLQALEQIDRYSKWLWFLSKHELGSYAAFDENTYSFELKTTPPSLSQIPCGKYHLINQKDGEHFYQYRLGHPLAESLINFAKSRELKCKEVTFRYDRHPTKVSLVEDLQGQSGWLNLISLTVSALEKEEVLIFSAIDDSGKEISAEHCTKLFGVGGEIGEEVAQPENNKSQFDAIFENQKQKLVSEISERDTTFYEKEMEKLENWADDVKESLLHELKSLDKQIKDFKKQARQTADLDSKVSLHKQAKDLEKSRREKRLDLYKAEESVDEQKEALIAQIEAKLRQSIEAKELFTIRWRVV